MIEREVMQELMTTGGLCDPAWSPDGKTFAAAGLRGVFTFTEPNFEPRVLVAGQLQAPPPGRACVARVPTIRCGRRAARAWRSDPAPAARRAFEVVDVKSAEVVLKRDGPVKALRWAGRAGRSLVDAARVAVP